MQKTEILGPYLCLSGLNIDQESVFYERWNNFNTKRQ